MTRAFLAGLEIGRTGNDKCNCNGKCNNNDKCNGNSNGKRNNNSKGEMRGSLRCATHDSAVSSFGRDDAVFGPAQLGMEV